MPLPRVTLKQIADLAKVHPTTVSMALRNHPRIPESTRSRLKALADQLGYVPDPMLASLNAYRHSSKHKQFLSKIAWLNICLDLDWPKKTRFIREYYSGALARAKELGFDLEVFNAHPLKLPSRRLQKILLSRGIQGIIVGPLQLDYPDAVSTIDMDWSKFCTITFGYSLESPEVDRVTNDHYHSVIEALRKLHELGFKKPGLFLSRRNNARIDRLWEAGYLVGMRTIFKTNPPPIALFEPFDNKQVVLKDWYETLTPDVIIAQDYESIRDSVERQLIPVPQQTTFVLLESNDKGFPYIDQNEQQIGATAISLLVGALQRHEHGLPTIPSVTLLKGSWTDGAVIG
jgi:LacI family transcriptional regulator